MMPVRLPHFTYTHPAHPRPCTNLQSDLRAVQHGCPAQQLHPVLFCCARLVQSDWRVVQRGYYAHVLGEAPHYFQDPVEAVRTLKKGNTVSGGGHRQLEVGAHTTLLKSCSTVSGGVQAM